MNAAPQAPHTPPIRPTAFFSAWPRSAQLTTAFLLGIVAALLGTRIASHTRWGSRPAEVVSSSTPTYRVDLNRANRAELLQLPGVGEGLATRIEGYRQERGSLGSVDELQNVGGIGPATLERLRPWVIINEGGEPIPNEKGTKADKLAAGAAPIDVNQASVTELQRLPGIGPKLAQRIVDERQRRPFQSVEELRRVSGIGAKTLEKLRPFVIVSTGTDMTVRSADR